MIENNKHNCNKIKLSKAQAMIRLNKRFYRGKGEIRYYYCKQCKAYHLTSKDAGSSAPAPAKIDIKSILIQKFHDSCQKSNEKINKKINRINNYKDAYFTSKNDRIEETIITSLNYVDDELNHLKTLVPHFIDLNFDPEFNAIYDFKEQAIDRAFEISDTRKSHKRTIMNHRIYEIVKENKQLEIDLFVNPQYDPDRQELIRKKWQNLNAKAQKKLEKIHGDNWPDFYTKINLKQFIHLTEKRCHICACKLILTNKEPVECPNSFTINYFLPFANNGKYEFNNLRACCIRCNVKKAKKKIKLYDQNKGGTNC